MSGGHPPTQTPTPPPAPKKRFQLAVIVGHEKAAQGAHSDILGTEYVFNSALAIDIQTIATNEHDAVCKVFFRDGLGIAGVGKAASDWARLDVLADAVVELHFNAANGVARGTEVLYDNDPPRSKAFADVMLKHVCAALGREGKSFGTILLGSGDRGYGNLQAVTVPSCLIEPAFGDTPADAQLLKDHRLDYARAIVAAAAEFVGV